MKRDPEKGGAIGLFLNPGLFGFRRPAAGAVVYTFAVERRMTINTVSLSR